MAIADLVWDGAVRVSKRGRLVNPETLSTMHVTELSDCLVVADGDVLCLTMPNPSSDERHSAARELKTVLVHYRGRIFTNAIPEEPWFPNSNAFSN